MKPNYKETVAQEGTTYRGEAFPLDQKLALRAKADQSRRYENLIAQHERNAHRRKVSFYTEFLTLVFGILSLILVISLFLTRKKD